MNSLHDAGEPNQDRYLLDTIQIRIKISLDVLKSKLWDTDSQNLYLAQRWLGLY